MRAITYCFLAAGLSVAAASLESTLQPGFASITPERLLAHIRTLASDEFAGRGPGTEGERKTVDYLISQSREMGLRPGNPDGTFTQAVPLWGMRSSGAVQVKINDRDLPVTAGVDYAASSTFPIPEINISGSRLVFVGYGVIAPEYGWDDYKGTDVKGKSVILLSGDPPVPDRNDPTKLDENMFSGKALSYYGRPATKYETAYKKGAVACLTIYAPRSSAATLAQMVRNTPRETMILRDETAEKRIRAQVLLDAAKAQELLTSAGQDLSSLRTAAAKADFRPTLLNGSVSIQVQNQLRKLDSQNVLAALPGSDPKLRDEYVIYSGHWDHLGQEGDRIYHGASDNAAGTAGVLELARAFTKLRPAPKRTVLFLWPTAEEKGLLGARYYVRHPLYPLEKTVADV